MILKDLIIIDKKRFIEIGAFVIIKRDDKYYEVPVRMRHDFNPHSTDPLYNDELDHLTTYKELNDRFMEECRRVNEYYVISTKTSQNIFGTPVHEEEIKF